MRPLGACRAHRAADQRFKWAAGLSEQASLMSGNGLAFNNDFNSDLQHDHARTQRTCHELRMKQGLLLSSVRLPEFDVAISKH